MTTLEKGLRQATYYEEKIINGIWYFRTDPNHAAFFPMSEGQLARKIAAKSFEARVINRPAVQAGDLIA